MIRKLIKVGSSTGVIIPKETLREIGAKAGDRIFVQVELGNKKGKIASSKTVNPEIVQWADDLIEKHRPLWEKLAKS